MLTMTLSLYQQQDCSTCGLPWHEDSQDFDIAFFGAKLTYKLCPRCRKEVDDSTQKDRNYRARWRRYVNKMKAKFSANNNAEKE